MSTVSDAPKQQVYVVIHSDEPPDTLVGVHATLAGAKRAAQRHLDTAASGGWRVGEPHIMGPWSEHPGIWCARGGPGNSYVIEQREVDQ